MLLHMLLGCREGCDGNSPVKLYAVLLKGSSERGTWMILKVSLSSNLMEASHLINHVENWSKSNSYKRIKNSLGAVVSGYNISRKTKSCVAVFQKMPKKCDGACSSRSQPIRWTTAIDVHLFFLIRKLPPVLQGAIIASVILVSATGGKAP